MAEFVQLNLESMLPEVEQLQRVQLFDEQEVKEMLRRRKEFEYKLQKREKCKNDFLQYIQYEMAVLALIEMRRKKLRYYFKKDEIEVSVIRRILKLFGILERRFKEDLDIYRAHIDFLKQIRWKDDVSRVYRRALAVHVRNAELWSSAANFELEEQKSVIRARNIFLEGIRFHTSSPIIYREYISFELRQAVRLRERHGDGGQDEVKKVKDEKSNEEKMDDGSEDKEGKEDAVLSGQLVLMVIDSAFKAVDEESVVSFACSLFSVSGDIKDEIVVQIEDKIEDFLRTHHADKSLTWDTLARKELLLLSDRNDPSLRTRIQNMCSVYEEGLSRNEEYSTSPQLFNCYLSSLFELSNHANAHKMPLGLLQFLLTKVEETMDYGNRRSMLTEEQFCNWIEIVGSEDEEKRRILVEKALKAFPRSKKITEMSTH